jgi:hypothetical protein
MSMVATKRKLDDQTSYTPCFGLVTSHQVDLAIAEYRRLESAGMEHGRILVAQRVPLAKWRRSQIPLSFGRVFFEADYEDSKVTKKTRADLYISKIPGAAHEIGRDELAGELRNYAHANGNLLVSGGGNVHLPGRDRCPDTGLSPYALLGENPPKHRLLIEIEITHRGLREILAYNDQMFAGIPQLRATFFLKVYSRRVGSRLFGALALLFRRLPGGVVCTDAVSCGTTFLCRSVVHDLPPAIGGVLRDLGVPPTLTLANPWPPALNPTITVPAQDLFYWRDDPVTGAHMQIPGAPDAAADLRICLWSIIWRINSRDPFC